MAESSSCAGTFPSAAAFIEMQVLDAHLRTFGVSRTIGQDEFLNLVRPVLRQAKGLAVGMLGNRADAEDAVQDAALKAWSRIGSFKPDTNFRGWFLAIVANECRQALRNGWRRVVCKPSVELGTMRARQDDVVDAESLKVALTRLSPDHRAVIILRFYLDLSFEDVGRMLGIGAATARTRTHRALNRLRPLIKLSEALDGD
jgi:RNA polymerase sigma-70 factor (ECF subfamily)